MLVKSHGLGNDYLVADPAELPFEVSPARVRLLCDRHRGVGSDGLLLLDATWAFGLRILNPDGSEAEKSGNGIRIFARWLVDTGRAREPRFVVHTPGGDVPVEVAGDSVLADMGVARVSEPVGLALADGGSIEAVAVDVGNPHCVVPRAHLDVRELRRLGPEIETHATFPGRTNVQLARALDRGRIELLIWERGAGETQASGSSACAAFAALHHLGQVDDAVTAAMPGGQLDLRLDERGHIWMRGPVEEVARIILSPDLIARLRALP
ncbi:MAG: diaminopimelate epimerase [Chloroflexota bacterium]|nr:diaminopimelate epimerase [Chloroflexota bacterium]